MTTLRVEPVAEAEPLYEPAPGLEPEVLPAPRTRRARPRRLLTPADRTLRAVPDDYVPRRIEQRRRRQRLTGGLVAAALTVLGIAAAHAWLVQGQLELQRLERKVDEAEVRYHRLRLSKADLESPDRIVAAAQERLGMVPPPGVTYLSPEGARAGATADAAPALEPTAPAWAVVKPYLASGGPGG